MEGYGLEFHHLGLAVSDPERALRFLGGMGYCVGEGVYDPEQNVNLILCTHNSMPDVEVIYPSGTPGPLDNILSANSESIYHTCYRSGNLEKSLEAMRAGSNRVICLSPPKPAILFNGSQVSFYLVKGFGMIEIIDVKEEQSF